MPKRVLSSELEKQLGKIVTVAGWIYSIRNLGNIMFVILRDCKGLIQVVITEKETIDLISKVQPETVVKASGVVTKTEGKSQFDIEIKNAKIKLISPVKDPLPVIISKKEIDAQLDTILDYRPLTLRHPKIRAIFNIQASILKAFADSMRKQGFVEFRSPVLMGVPSETGADVFEVKYFQKKAYLAQSPQLYKQIMVGVFERVFTITPVFRAEKHNTTRHLMELTQLDGEVGFIKDYNDILDIVENTVRHIVKYIKENNKEDLELLDVDIPRLPKGKFPRVKVKEALKIIEKITGKSASRKEIDLDPEDEREIGKWALKKFNSDFIWLIGFKKDKNFYTWNNPEDPDESLSFDLEFRGLEVLSGTHRIHDYDKLLECMKKHGLSKDNYNQYLMAFKYGMPPEGGFSFGLERLTKQFLNLKNIREATLFPSDLTRISGQRFND
uniref:Aspartate--tRNA ligase n=1 Tax=candidate division CPR3 bacterium TaxID=2268181 RepID=A0A7C5YVX7_UNCC3